MPFDPVSAGLALLSPDARNARRGLQLAFGRLLAADRVDLIWTSAIECAWWASVIDDAIRRGLDDRSRKHPGSYQAARTDDDDGVHLTGLLYARDRYTHQLVTPLYEDAQPFFALPGADYVLYLSPGWVWLPIDQLPPADPGFKHEHEVDAYTRALTGQKPSATVARTIAWFERLEESVEPD